MENHVIVRTEHLNHRGSLFGGQMLLWVDESAYMAAIKDYPHVRLVTRAISNIEFKKPVTNGSVCRIISEKINEGNSSVTYGVIVYAQEPDTTETELVLKTQITFVAVDKDGNKVSLKEN